MIPSRDYRLDLIRGLALLVIYVDHVSNSWLRFFTPQGWQVCDFAEVFVFISGFTASLAYGRRAPNGIGASLAKAVRRAWKLYRWYVGTLAVTLLTVQLALMAGWPPLGSGFLTFGQSPWHYMARALYFRNVPNVLSVLALYVVLGMALPVIAWIGRNGLLKLILLSVTLYLSSYLYTHWFPPAVSANPIELEDWGFKPLAWQLMFIAGYIWPRVRWPQWTRSRSLFWLGCGVVILCGLLTLVNLYGPAFHLRGTAKDALGILRIVNFAGWILVVHAFWDRLPKLSWLIACGRHSLTIFCVGVWLSVVTSLLIGAVHAGAIVQFAIVCGGVALLVWLAAMLDRTRSTDPTLAPEATSPIVPATPKILAP